MTHWQWDDREEEQDDVGEGQAQGLGESGERDYLAHAGASWDPYEDEPQARREALRPLLGEGGATLMRAPAALLSGSGDEKLEFLLSLPEPERLIQALSAEEYVFLVKDIGLSDGGPLLAMASPRQLQACIDMDCWQGDEVDADTFFQWFEAAREAGDGTDERLVAAQEDGLLCQILLKKLRAIPWHPEVDQELPDDMDVFESPDGSARLLGEVDDDGAAVAKQVLETLFRIDLLRARAILKGMYWEVQAQLTDDLVRSRTARLEDAGFAPKEEAQKLYLYRDPHAYAADLRQAWRTTGDHQADQLRSYLPSELPGIQSDPDEAPLLGLALPSDGLKGGFLGRVMAALDHDVAERLQIGLVRLANRVQAARAPSLAATLELSQWGRHALQTAAMGLEHLSGGDVPYAMLLTQVEGPTDLFTAGHSLVVIEHHRARRLRTALGGSAGIDLLEPDDAALVRALLQPLPGVPSATALDGTMPGDTRPVQSLAELQAVRLRLRALESSAGLIARLAGGSMADALALIKPGRAGRLSTLFNTAVAWHVLQGQAELRPLDTVALRTFLSAALVDGKVRPELRHALLSGLLTRVDRSDEEVEALEGMVNQSLDRLAEELGGLSAMGLLDARYVGDALLVAL